MNRADQIESIHKLYWKLTGQFLRLDMGREHSWSDYLAKGFSEYDLRLVIAHLKDGIRSGTRYPACLKFSNLIQQLDHFEEDLAMAKAHSRNDKPKTNREKVVEAYHPTATSVALDQKEHCKHVNEILPKLIEEMRKAAK